MTVDDAPWLAVIGLFLVELRRHRLDIGLVMRELRGELRELRGLLGLLLGRRAPDVGGASGRRAEELGGGAIEGGGGGDPAPVDGAAAGLHDETQGREKIGERDEKRARLKDDARASGMAEEGILGHRGRFGRAGQKLRRVIRSKVARVIPGT